MKMGEVFHQPLVAAVLLAVGLVPTSRNAFADSPRSWGYWDAVPAAGSSSQGASGYSQLASSAPTTANSANQDGEQINTTQNITGMDRGSVRLNDNSQSAALTEGVSPIVVVPEIPHSEYIAYFECKSHCNGDNLTISKVGFTLEGVNDIKGSQRVGSTSLTQTTIYDISLSAVGFYDGSPLYLTDDHATVRHIETYSFDGNYREQVIVSAESVGNSLTGRSGGFSDVTGIASINTEKGSGQAVWGKRIAASEIQAQLRKGQSYRFSGTSTYASVEMSVDFQNASWDGKWVTTSGAPHNGFNAGGKFTKAGNLQSDFVKGSGLLGIDGFVKGGRVDASLTQAIHGPGKAMGVIGQSSVEVVDNGLTKRVVENFKAIQN